MRHAACALAIALGAAVAASAQDATPPAGETPPGGEGPFDVRAAISGVWALDPRDIIDPGDFTCDQKPLSLQITHDGRGIASLRSGDENFIQGAIIDVRNDFPEGPAMTILWEDSPKREDGEFDALVLYMPDPDKFVYIRSSDMIRAQATGEPLHTVPHARCAVAAPEEEGIPTVEDGPSE